jgi:voltage-gated potassium channel Kch
MADFFYFSVLTFTTTGFGDIIPITKTAKALVTMEVMVAFITTIIVISNFVHIKDSIHDLSFIKIQKRLNRKKTQGKRSESEELVDE